MTTQKFDAIDAPANRLGECPIWCEQTGTLWWVDVLTPALMSYVPQAGQVQQHKVEARRIGSLALREKGGLILACDNGLFAFDPKSGAQTFLVDPEPGVSGHRKTMDARIGRAISGSAPCAKRITHLWARFTGYSRIMPYHGKPPTSQFLMD